MGNFSKIAALFIIKLQSIKVDSSNKKANKSKQIPKKQSSVSRASGKNDKKNLSIAKKSKNWLNLKS